MCVPLSCPVSITCLFSPFLRPCLSCLSPPRADSFPTDCSTHFHRVFVTCRGIAVVKTDFAHTCLMLLLYAAYTVPIQERPRLLPAPAHRLSPQTLGPHAS